MPILPKKYQSDDPWIEPTREKRLRRASASLQWLQLECISDVLRLWITLTESGARVRERHATPCWTVQTLTPIGKILISFLTRAPGAKSNWDARILTGGNQYVQGQSCVVFPCWARLVLVCELDHEVLLWLGAWRALVCHSEAEECWLGRLVAPRRQLQTQNGVHSQYRRIRVQHLQIALRENTQLEQVWCTRGTSLS